MSVQPRAPSHPVGEEQRETGAEGRTEMGAKGAVVQMMRVGEEL